MSRSTRLSSLTAMAAIAVTATGARLHAQSLTDFCPGADEEKSSVLIGSVQDPDLGMILPGSDVVATWTEAGTTKQAQATVGIDGAFVLCGLPRAVEVSVRAVVAGRSGDAVGLTLADPIGQ